MRHLVLAVLALLSFAVGSHGQALSLSQPPAPASVPFATSAATCTSCSTATSAASATTCTTATSSSTATALASDPSACASGLFVTDIAASGSLTCLASLDSPLGKLAGAALDSTADQPITVINAAKYSVEKILVTNCSGTPVLAAGGIYTAAPKGGSTVVAAGQVYTALTASTKMLALTLESVTGTDVFTAQTLYFSLTVANVAAVTCDVYLFGRRLP